MSATEGIERAVLRNLNVGSDVVFALVRRDDVRRYPVGAKVPWATPLDSTMSTRRSQASNRWSVVMASPAARAAGPLS